MLRDPKIKLTKEHRAKICLDMICEFMHIYPEEEFENPDKTNFSTWDYTLLQFQKRIGKFIPYNPKYLRRKMKKQLKNNENDL